MSSAFGTETVLDVRHWTNDYFSFTTSRDDGFRFDNGQFVMIGLEVAQPDGTRRPLLRAYSIPSANWEEQLEFFSIKVPDGPLTSRLRDIAPGDRVLVGRLRGELRDIAHAEQAFRSLGAALAENLPQGGF